MSEQLPNLNGLTKLRVTFGVENHQKDAPVQIESLQISGQLTRPVQNKDSGYVPKSTNRGMSESSLRESDLSDNLRSEAQTPTGENYLKPKIIGVAQVDTQVFAQEFDLDEQPNRPKQILSQNKRSNAPKKTIVSFNSKSDLDAEVAAITGVKNVDQAIGAQEDLSSHHLNVDATIASLGIHQDSNLSLISPKAKHFVSNSTFSQAFSPHGSKDFSLPSIDRRAVSILDTTTKAPPQGEAIKKAQSQLKTRLEIEAKIKDKRNNDIFQTAQEQLKISRVLFDPTKPFRGGKIMEHFLAQPQLFSEKSIGSAFYQEIELQEERNGLHRRSQSVKPDDKALKNIESDLRQAFQQFQKGSMHNKRQSVAPPRNLSQTIENSRPQSRLLKDNLIINNGSEVAILPVDEAQSHVEDNQERSKAMFIEQALIGLIDKERKDAKNEAARTNKLNYQSKPLGLIVDNEELAKRNLSTIGRAQEPTKQSGTRFDKDLTSKNGSIPPQILEEWINQTLQGDSESDQTHATDGLPRKFKTKQTKKLTQLMQIDYSSLCRNGMPSDKAAQLLRALFVHSVGFYKHIVEMVFHLKGKKDVIMNVWRVFYMLLESCQKVEHKMVMIELAESFEVEKIEFRKQLKDQASEYEQKITVLKNEINEQVGQILSLQDQIMRGEDEYNRLNQTYLILASQNEEALTLRLRTEARLKELFSRERLREQEFAMLKQQKQETSAKFEFLNQTIEEQKAIIEQHSDHSRDINAQIKVLENELSLTKKQNRIYKTTIDQQMLPRKRLQHQVTLQTSKADYIEARHEDLERQVEMISRQKDDAMSEVQILRNLTNNQRAQVASFEEQSKAAINKMTDLQAELDKRIGLITNIDQTLQEKDEKIITLKKKVEQWRTERYEFAAETDSVKDRLEEANKTIEKLKRDLVKQDEAVQKLYRTILEKEDHVKQELARNAELQKKFDEKDEKLVHLSTTTFEQMEREITRQMLEIQKIKTELQLKASDREQENRLHKDQVEDLRKENKLMEELMKKKRSENIMIESNNSEINNTNMRLNAKNIELEAQIKQLQKKASMSEAKLTRQKNETDRRSIEMLEVQGELEKLDNSKGIVEKQLELTIANKDFIIQNLRDTIKVYDTRDQSVYEPNMMMGEDHRSQALENYCKILDLEAQIGVLKQIPIDQAAAFLRERTQLNRTIECLGLEIAEGRSDLKEMYAQVRHFKEIIEPLKLQNADLKLTIKKLKHLVGDDDLQFVEIETQTEIVTIESSCQTKAKKVADHGVQKDRDIITHSQEMQTDHLSPQHSESKFREKSPPESLPKHKVKITKKKKKPNSIHEDVTTKGRDMTIVVNESRHRQQSSSSDRSVSVSRKRHFKRDKRPKNEHQEHHQTPRLLGKGQFIEEKKQKKASPSPQRQVEVRITQKAEKNDASSHKMDTSIYTEMQETKRLNSHRSNKEVIAIDAPRLTSPTVEFLHVEKTVILSKKASQMPTKQHASPDLNRTNASHFSIGQHLGQTNDNMRRELSAYERAMIRDLTQPAITRNESMAQTLLDSQESARQVLIAESVTKDGFAHTNNKYFGREKERNQSGPHKQAFVPFKPSEIDLVGPNKLVYEYRMQLKNYVRGGLSQSPSHLNVHIPTQLNLNTVDLNENVRFQERLESHRHKVKSYIKLAAMTNRNNQ